MSKVLLLDYKINPLMTSVMSGRNMYVYELTYNHYQLITYKKNVH